jgi:hypothetical protein
LRLSRLVLPLINLNLNPLIYGNVLSLRLQLRLNPSSKPQATFAQSRFKYSPKRPGSVPSPGQPIRVPPRRALARPGARLVSLASGVVLNLNFEFRTEPHCNLNSSNVIRQKRMRILTFSRTASSHGWATGRQHLSGLPGLLLSLGRTAQLSIVALTQGHRRPGTVSVTQWQGAVWIPGSSGVGVPAQAHPSLTTVTIAAQPSRHSKYAASRSAAAAAAWRVEAPLPAAERRGRHCRCTTS